MTQEYTPGPWKQASTQHGDEYAANVLSDNDLNKDADFICHCYPVRGDLDKAEANARLIAAAPELLEALQNLLNAPDLNLDSLEEETVAAIDEALAVIKKATGGAEK